MQRAFFGASVLALLLGLAGAVRDSKYYDVLGIGTDADDRTIQKAYRRQALRYHPDRNPDKPDAEHRFREVAHAYEVLSDPEKRRQYDQLGEEGMKAQQQGGGPGGHAGGFHFHNPQDIFETVFGGMGGQRMRFQFGGGSGGGGQHFQFGGGGRPGGGFPGGQQQQQFRQQGGGGGGAGLYDNDAFVVDLNEDTYPENDGDGWVWLIEFYAPWCGHCRQLAPKWRALAHALSGTVKVAAVNCEQQQALCQAQRIQGYPTIKALAGGKMHDYSGQRSGKALKAWALGLLPNHVRSVASGSQLDALLHSCMSGGGSASRWGLCVLLLTPKRETGALYKSLALRYAGKAAFGEVRGASAGSGLAQELGVTQVPALLAFCSGSREAVIPYEGEMKGTRLSKWLNSFYDGKKCAGAIKLDASTDFGRLRVGQLRQALAARGEACDGCVEKEDYVRRVKQVYGLTS